MNTILALDSSTEACSVALQSGGSVLSRFEVAPRRHAELLLPMVEGLLEEAGISLMDLDALVYGRGPGAFTGIRIAVSVAQGLAFGAGVPTLGVSALRAMAQGAAEEADRAGAPADRVLVALDARMGEIYTGAFERDESGLMQPVGEERVLPPADLQLPDVWQAKSVLAIGNGWQVYKDSLALPSEPGLTRESAQRFPDAAWMIRLAKPLLDAGQAEPAEQARPVYLRDQVAKKAVKKPQQ